MPNGAKKHSSTQPTVIGARPPESVSQEKATGIQARVLTDLGRFFTGDGLTMPGKWEVHVLC